MGRCVDVVSTQYHHQQCITWGVEMVSVLLPCTFGLRVRGVYMFVFIYIFDKHTSSSLGSLTTTHVQQIKISFPCLGSVTLQSAARL